MSEIEWIEDEAEDEPEYECTQCQPCPREPNYVTVTVGGNSYHLPVHLLPNDSNE